MSTTGSGSTANGGADEGMWRGSGCDGMQQLTVEPGDCLILWVYEEAEPINQGTANVDFQYAGANAHKVTVREAGTFSVDAALAHVLPDGESQFIVLWCT